MSTGNTWRRAGESHPEMQAQTSGPRVQMFSLTFRSFESSPIERKKYFWWVGVFFLPLVFTWNYCFLLYESFVPYINKRFALLKLYFN